MSKALYLFLSKFLPSCREVSRLVSESCERKLSWKERILIKSKRSICHYTDKYVDQVTLLHQTTQTKSEDLESNAPCPKLSEERKEKMKALLQDQD